jgi:hypothetical protein
MKYIENDIPKRKSKPKQTPLDGYEPYQKLRLMILNGRLKPMEQVGILLDSEDSRKLKMKHPWRTVADHLRRIVRDLGLQAEYNIVKYETDTSGAWFVRVTRNDLQPKS